MWSRFERLLRFVGKYDDSSTDRLTQNLGRWFGKAFWAVTDQGLFATSNFLVNLLLARWLVPQDYGIFTVAFTVTLLWQVLYYALITEPMLVFGPGRYREHLSEYLGILVYAHLGFASLSVLLLMIISLVLALSGSSALSVVLVASALAGPLISLLWLMRRACYTRLAPHLAALGGGLYVILMLGGTYILYWRGWLSAVSAFGVMGVASLLVSLWLAVRLRTKLPSLSDKDRIRDALQRHWDYGRWSIATRVLYWTPANIYYLLLPVWAGFEASAALKALMNLFMPILQTNVALSAILVPTLVQARAHAGFRTYVRLALVPFVLGPVLYWILLGAFHRPIVSTLYAGKYLDHADMVWLLGLLPVASGITAVTSAALRAMERPDQLFWAYVPSTVIALTVGLALMFAWGTSGAATALVITYAATAIVTSLVYLRLRSEPSEEGKVSLAENRTPTGD